MHSRQGSPPTQYGRNPNRIFAPDIDLQAKVSVEQQVRRGQHTLAAYVPQSLTISSSVVLAEFQEISH